MSDEIKELAIGEEGVIDGVKVRCVDKHKARGSYICPDCCFDTMGFDKCKKVACGQDERSDKHYVIFEEVK